MDSIIYLFSGLTAQKALLFLLLSVGPTLVWLLICLRFDRSAPETGKQIFKTFILGAILTLPIVFVAGYLTDLVENKLKLASFASILITAFLVDGLIEESAKYFILRWRIYKSPYFDELRDGFVYGMVLALGLAFVENFFYGLISGSLIRGSEIILIRGVTTTFLHFLSGGIIGYYLSLVKIGRRRSLTAFWGLFLAILLHGFYNTVIGFGWWWNVIPIVFILVGVYLIIFKKIRRISSR